MPLIFGAASLCMGIVLVTSVSHMPVMVLSVLLGTLLGELLLSGERHRLSGRESARAGRARGPGGSRRRGLPRRVSAKIRGDHCAFCASGYRYFGAMHEGMTGDNSVLIAKAFLDLLTALIFATTLGYAVALVAVPQLIIQLVLAWSAVFILPMTTPGHAG